jgi:hypothetical protein
MYYVFMFGVMLIYPYTMFVCIVASRRASGRGSGCLAGKVAEQEFIEDKLFP